MEALVLAWMESAKKTQLAALEAENAQPEQQALLKKELQEIALRKEYLY